MAIISDARSLTAERTGIGLRLPHIAEVVATRPPVGWLEIHPENFLANPHGLELLTDLAREYPVSVHTVGISIGSADGIDRDHLIRLRALVDRLNPVLVSGHLAWSSIGGAYLNDLLPVPYNAETLARVSDHIDEVQETLQRRMLLENPSTYVAFEASTMSEVEFLREVVGRTGCGLLLDVNNVYVSALNHGPESMAYLDQFPMEHVGEIHLGGHFEDRDDLDAPLLIDAHGTPVAETVWLLYARTLARLGAMPTLIEWDNDVPAFSVLAAEAERALGIMTAETKRRERRDAAAAASQGRSHAEPLGHAG